MIFTAMPLGCLLLLALVMPLTAQTEPASDDRDERIAELEGEVTELNDAFRELLGLSKEMRKQLDMLLGRPSDTDAFYIPRQSADFAESGQPASLGDIYTKPFLSEYGESTYIGGHIDLEFFNYSGSSKNKEFDQHRLVPFLYSDVSENVKVAAEVEIEHGHELEVEFAQMDFLFNENINLRAGIQLLPLGKLNEVHDSPIQDLTARPLVNRFIIPTTLRDAGLGVWGDITENVSYQATVTNGFSGLADDGTSAITAKNGLRNAAPHKDTIGDSFENINDSLAYTARIAYTPVLGVETGFSGLFDTYDESGDNHLRILALDATVNGKAIPLMPDNMEFLYEGAWADIQRDSFARASGVAGDMEGHYVQANVHFAPDFLSDSAEDGGFVQDGAHFTFVTRYGAVELDDYTMRRTTLGINFRPNESSTVMKLDYLMNGDHGSESGSNSDNAWALSFASYF